MKEVTCPDCGAAYAADVRSCPKCGCPNDNWQPQEEQPSKQPTYEDPNEDFNESRQYSPFSSDSWFLKAPWPLSLYPNRKDFEKNHPFWGWLFNPWYLTCKSKTEKEEYATINNIFYLFNLIFKTQFYAGVYTFCKSLLFWLVYVVLGMLIIACDPYGDSFAVLASLLSILYFVILVLSLIIWCCGMGKALHRYWPSIHRTWRRLNKRYWNAMKN